MMSFESWYGLHWPEPQARTAAEETERRGKALEAFLALTQSMVPGMTWEDCFRKADDQQRIFSIEIARLKKHVNIGKGIE